MHLVLHTLSFGNVLFGRAFLLILLLASGRASTAVDGSDLCSNSHCFSSLPFFVSLFCISFQAACLALFSFFVLSPVD